MYIAISVGCILFLLVDAVNDGAFPAFVEGFCAANIFVGIVYHTGEEK